MAWGEEQGTGREGRPVSWIKCARRPPHPLKALVSCSVSACAASLSVVVMSSLKTELMPVTCPCISSAQSLAQSETQ